MLVAGQSDMAVGQTSRHFLFYLRDETFECEADDWILEQVTNASSPEDHARRSHG